MQRTINQIGLALLDGFLDVCTCIKIFISWRRKIVNFFWWIDDLLLIYLRLPLIGISK